LAESAFAAPVAEFGGQRFYEGLHLQAAVLFCRLIWNHPLVDTNKRCAFLAMKRFIEMEGGSFGVSQPRDKEIVERTIQVATCGHGLEGAARERAQHDATLDLAEWLRTWIRQPVALAELNTPPTPDD